MDQSASLHGEADLSRIFLRSSKQFIKCVVRAILVYEYRIGRTTASDCSDVELLIPPDRCSLEQRSQYSVSMMINQLITISR
ncbi:hypothetical protein SDC9_151664 [bioreactor metagenome]|uniref:Uncharacterized protein n=1 Tax=bioreactor metagenome TaxID=1076179 RepID=A0A645ESL3_9ZZZZ